MRGALLVTFLVSSVQGLGVLALAGRLSADSLIPAAMLLPAVVLGVVVVALGRRLTESLPAVISLPCESVLRRALGVIVVLGGLSGLVRGLLGGVVR